MILEGGNDKDTGMYSKGCDLYCLLQNENEKSRYGEQ